MTRIEVTYKGFVLIPLAAYDAGIYAAMVIVKDTDQSQRAFGVLGNFADAESASRFAVECGMAEVDKRQLSHTV